MDTPPNIKVSTISKISNKFKKSLIQKLQGETGYSIEIILGLLQDDREILKKYRMTDPETILDIPTLLRSLSSEASSIMQRFFDDIIFAKSLRTMPLKDIDAAVNAFIQNGGEMNPVIHSTILSRKKEPQNTIVELSTNLPIQKITTHTQEKIQNTTGLSPELLSLLERGGLSRGLGGGGSHNKKKSQFYKK